MRALVVLLVLTLVACEKKKQAPPPAAPAAAPVVAAPPAPTKAKPVALDKGAFAGEGFRIENVPAGMSFFATDRADDPPTWEVRDASGQRVAVIQEESWNHVASPAVGPSKTKVGGLDSARQEREVKDWGGAPARIVTDTFESKEFIYHLERRPGVADWVVQNWKIVPAKPGVRLDMGKPERSLLQLDLKK